MKQPIKFHAMTMNNSDKLKGFRIEYGEGTEYKTLFNIKFSGTNKSYNIGFSRKRERNAVAVKE
jgi:hypothetical protein